MSRFYTFLVVGAPALVQLALMSVLGVALFGADFELLLGRLMPAAVDENVRLIISRLLDWVGPGDIDGEGLIFGSVGGVGFLLAFTISNIWAVFVPIVLARSHLVSTGYAAWALAITCAVFTVSHAFIYQIGHICEVTGVVEVCTSGVTSAPYEIGKAIFLSATMMTSLGFGDYLPGDDIRLYVAGQSIAGLIAISAVIAMATTPKNTRGNRSQERILIELQTENWKFERVDYPFIQRNIAKMGSAILTMGIIMRRKG